MKGAKMYQVRIIGGTIVDGTGSEPYQGNVYVEGDRIALISPELLPAEETLDAAGLAVAPGFIDVHTHSDVAPWCAPGMESYAHQGVTTSINGNCGGSLVPHKPEDHDACAKARASAKYGRGFTGADYKATDVGSYLKEINGLAALNNGMLVGHGQLRNMCMSDPLRTEPTSEELEAMKQVLRENLRQGAFGLSLGLIYLPGTYAKTEELIELAKVVAEFDALVTVHMRNEGSKVFEAMEEMAQVARASGVRVEISHLKIGGWPGHGDELLERMDRYKAEGLRFTFDQYPYSASSTGLAVLIPKEVKQRPSAQVMELLKDDEQFDRLIRPALDAGFKIRTPEQILICFTRGRLPECDGKTIGEIGRMWNMSPTDTIRELLIRCNMNVQTVFFSMDPADCEKIARRMDVSVISDSSAFDFLSREVPGTPHPRNFGTFVRFLRLARERDLMPLEKAVRKMTGLPAEVFGIPERGLLKEGYFADITVFDPKTVSDNGDYLHPAELATGVKAVFVNGVKAFEDGRPTGSRSGRGLARPVADR